MSSLFYHPKGTILEEFLLSQDMLSTRVWLLETSLAHGGSEGLGQGDHQTEDFTGLLGHHVDLGPVIAAGEALNDSSHDGLGEKRLEGCEEEYQLSPAASLRQTSRWRTGRRRWPGRPSGRC